VTAQMRFVQEDNRVFIDMAAGNDNPCTACGVCCQYFRISFYAGELAGMPQGTVPSELTSKLGPFHACMKGTEAGNGRCIALQGEVGQPGIGCAIYADRPTPCREFPVWMPDGTPNPDCQRIRAANGLAPLGPQLSGCDILG
jgi:uncharacterized protein